MLNRIGEKMDKKRKDLIDKFERTIKFELDSKYQSEKRCMELIAYILYKLPEHFKEKEAIDLITDTLQKLVDKNTKAIFENFDKIYYNRTKKGKWILIKDYEKIKTEFVKHG